jgi:hypothetical protein
MQEEGGSALAIPHAESFSFPGNDDFERYWLGGPLKFLFSFLRPAQMEFFRMNRQSCNSVH